MLATISVQHEGSRGGHNGAITVQLAITINSCKIDAAFFAGLRGDYDQEWPNQHCRVISSYRWGGPFKLLRVGFN